MNILTEEEVDEIVDNFINGNRTDVFKKIVEISKRSDSIMASAIICF